MELSSYTWLHPKHQLLAMSYSTYVPLDIANIHNCFHFGNTYFCEQVFLTQHSTKHTCENAIYYELDIDMIKWLCNFSYYPSLIPEPTVLDSGSKLLLANLPLPWTFFCTHEKQIPNDIEGASYVMLDKSYLCLCSITAGSLYLHENIVSCSHKNTSDSLQMRLKYTINKALMIFFPALIPDQDLKLDIIFSKPREIDIANPESTIAHDSDIVHPENNKAISLSEAVHNIISHQEQYLSKADKALGTDNFDNWVTGKTSSMTFIFFSSLITIVCFCLIILLIYCYFSLKSKVTSSIPKKVSNIPKMIPGYYLVRNTLGRFRNSMKRKPKEKPIKQFDRKRLRPFEKSTNPSSRTIPMRTFRSSRSCTITPEPISVQAQINRIEEFKQHHNVQSLNNMLYSSAGIDNTAYEPSDPPYRINPNSIKCSNCRSTENELV